MDQHDCPFCRLEKNRIRLESEFALAFLDGFPVSQGHTLVIPKRHVASLFELPAVEQAAVWALVSQVRALLLVLTAVESGGGRRPKLEALVG